MMSFERCAQLMGGRAQLMGGRWSVAGWLIALGLALAVPAWSGAPRAGDSAPHGLPGPLMVPSIQALTTVGSQTVYAGSFGMGVFKSEDRGGSWTGANAGLTDPFILCLASAPDGTVYVGTFRGGIYRTKDGGKTWQTINAGLKRLEVKALLVRPGVVYAGTGDGLYRLTEGESEWKAVNQGLEDVLVHTVALAPDQTIFVGTSGKGLLRRKPNTQDWQRMTHGLIDHEGLRENFIRVLTFDRDKNLYAGTFDGGVFQSGDGGVSWRPISRALPNDSIRSIIASERGLYVATGRGVFKTVNQGGQWIGLNKGLTELSVQSLVIGEGGTLYAGTSAGAFRSDDDGTSWVGISDGLAGIQQSPFGRER